MSWLIVVTNHLCFAAITPSGISPFDSNVLFADLHDV